MELPVNQIIEGDCLEVMRDFPANSVDAIVTDPPFFTPATHYQSRFNWGKKWSDMSILTTWWSVIAIELRRVCKDEGHVLAFCNADSYPAFYPAMYNLWDKLVCLIWDKERPGMGRVWRHQHEMIIAARNKGHYLPNDGILRPDILSHKATLSRDRKHPVEKPAEMLQELIKAIAPRGSIILDPFAGSGTTLQAAILEHCDYIGIEQDPEYAEIARARVAHNTPKSAHIP